MNDKLILLSVNDKYPTEFTPYSSGATAEFLRSFGNKLVFLLPNISHEEIYAFRVGEIRAGILVKNGAILFVWQVWHQGKTIITFDSVFDSKLIPDINLYDIPTENHRLAIEVHVIDSANNVLRLIRLVSMPNEMTVEFLAAVQDQITGLQDGAPQNELWRTKQPYELAHTTKMWQLGT